MQEDTQGTNGGGRSFKWWVAGSCLVGLGVRLVYAFWVKAGTRVGGDAAYYHGQARLNTKGHWFVNPFVFDAKHHVAAMVPSAQHPPLFTVFLTVADFVGLPSAGDQLVLVCLLGTATIGVAGFITRELVSPRAGAIAAVVAALYPGLWIYDGEIMSEALVMLLSALTILAAIRCYRACTTGRVVVLGLLTGLCALTRAELVLLVPLVALPTIAWQRSVRWRRRAALGGIAVAMAVAPMLPWFARNAVVFHHPVYLSDQLALTVAAANNDVTYYGPLTASWCFRCQLDVRFPPGEDESDQARYWEARARRYIDSHRARALAVAAARVGIEWNAYLPLRQIQEDFFQGWPEPVSRAWLVWYYPLIASALAGAVILRRRREPIYPMVAMFIVVTLAAVATYGNQRFRAEAEVAIVVLAAVALDALWSAGAGRPPRNAGRSTAGAGRLPGEVPDPCASEDPSVTPSEEISA